MKKRKKSKESRTEEVSGAPAFASRLRQHVTAVMFEILKDSQRVARALNPDETLRLSHYSVLAYLAEHGAHSQKEISDALRFNASDLVGVLDKLQDAELLERAVDPTDRRRHTLTLTKSGKIALEKRDERASDFEKEFLKVLEPKERAALLELLLKLLDAHKPSSSQP